MSCNILYVRVSSLHGQKTDRQKLETSKYFKVVEDKCSGAIPFFKRPGGMEILQLIEKKHLSELHVHSIDRMFRDTKDMVNTVAYFNEKLIPIYFISQNLRTLNENLEKDPIVSMIIHITGIFADLTRENIKIAQAEGIAVAKAKGVYLGRKKGTLEDSHTFISKPKNKKALELLKKGYKGIEIAKIVGLHPNTITKIRKHLKA